jgi:hypothetical protein
MPEDDIAIAAPNVAGNLAQRMTGKLIVCSNLYTSYRD